MCLYCGAPGPNHKACIEAWSLDYDPKSEEDAERFLKERRERIEKDMVRAREEYARKHRILPDSGALTSEESESARSKEFYER